MGIILEVNEWMVPFLKTFGLEKGNGLSPFAVNIDSPHALVELVKEYFKYQLRTCRCVVLGRLMRITRRWGR